MRLIRTPGSMLNSIKNIFRRRKLKKVHIGGKMFYKYGDDLYPEYLNNGNASENIIPFAKKYCKGKGIDVGAGRNPFPGAIAIDNSPNQNAYRLDLIDKESLDYVFSSHCLEHLAKWQYALDLWTSKLKRNGILFLYLPHPSMKLWNRGHIWVADHHKWIPNSKIIMDYLKAKNMQILHYNSEKDHYWSFHIVAKKS